MIEPGSDAPGFTLADQDGNDTSLTDYRGRRLVIAFYPLDFSPVCTDQLSVYEEVLPDIEERGASLVGISVDSQFCHNAFRDRLGLTMSLLADFEPKGAVAASYGAYLPKWGHSNRSLVLVDGEGVVRWSYATETPLEIPGANLIFDALDA
jgi:peroxiredoxin